MRGRRRNGTEVKTHVSSLASTISANANHCWRSVRQWSSGPLKNAVAVAKEPDGSHRFALAGGRFIKFPTWALTSGTLSRLAIVALLGVCSGLSYTQPDKPVPMSRQSLRNRTGLHERSITKALNELVEAGVITKVHRSDGCGRRLATAYRINWDKSAREGPEEGARQCHDGTARQCPNNSEVLFSEDNFSDPPTPAATKPGAVPSQVVEGISQESNASGDPSQQLIVSLESLHGTWAPLLRDAHVTRRDRRRISRALRGQDPSVVASDLEAATPPHTMHGVRRPLGVLPHRLADVVRHRTDEPPASILNPAQRLMRSKIAGEIAAGYRSGQLENWQQMIDELA